MAWHQIESCSMQRTRNNEQGTTTGEMRPRDGLSQAYSSLWRYDES